MKSKISSIKNIVSKMSLGTSGEVKWNRRTIVTEPFVKISMVLYCLSLVLKAVNQLSTSSSQESPTPGWAILVLGWTTILYGQYAWFANPFLFIGWICSLKKKMKAAIIVSAVSVLFSIHIFIFNEQKIDSDEAGNCCAYIEFLVGSYFWFAAIAVQFFASTTVFLLKKGNPPPLYKKPVNEHQGT